MKHQPASRYRPFQRGRIPQIPGYRLYIKLFQALYVSNQRPDRMAPLQQFPRNVPSKKPGGACNQCRLHRTLTAVPFN